MNSDDRNTIKSLKRLLIAVGVIVASLVVWQEAFGASISDHSMTQKRSLIDKSFKNVTIYLGRFSGDIRNNFD